MDDLQVFFVVFSYYMKYFRKNQVQKSGEVFAGRGLAPTLRRLSKNLQTWYIHGSL